MFPCETLQTQITAEVGKITKTVQRDLTFIFDVLSEFVISFVSFAVSLAVMAVKNVVIFTLNDFSRKWGCESMRNYAETSMYHDICDMRHKVFV